MSMSNDPLANTDGAPSPEDITEERSTLGDRLQGTADEILAAGARPRPLRQAVREDATEVREWARRHGAEACDAIRDEPMRMTLYALGIGVLIGLLAAR
ncbi:hypothetical protein [Brevundimonas guildfordensis]|uniref:DUF883 domain-containing protein n=1 Tax=Brevundimonas guildfordensis TaxID=2762241 RepID=A0ABR8QX61_9CAUL|nr:hypothetical protein [Brevundimonas guildfordensis]MBD7940128.1 hypothetical protein [Brevundimonas guildfordensis]